MQAGSLSKCGLDCTSRHHRVHKHNWYAATTSQHAPIDRCWPENLGSPCVARRWCSRCSAARASSWAAATSEARKPLKRVRLQQAEPGKAGWRAGCTDRIELGLDRRAAGARRCRSLHRGARVKRAMAAEQPALGKHDCNPRLLRCHSAFHLPKDRHTSPHRLCHSLHCSGTEFKLQGRV